MKTVLLFCSSLRRAALVGYQEEGSFSTKDMEVGRRLRVCLKEYVGILLIRERERERVKGPENIQSIY